MDIQHLKYFVTLCELKNFTRASEHLFISQPMLTRCIQCLEDELDTRLIERTSRSFRLTDAGQVFLAHANQLLSEHNDFLRNLQDIRHGNVGEVSISSPGVLLDIYFPQLLSQFRQLYPGININIVEEGSKLTVASVMKGTADLGLVMLPVENMSELDILPVISDHVCLMVRTDHPFARKHSVHVGELRNCEVITYSQTSILHDTFLRMCTDEGFVPKIVCKSLMPLFVTQMISLNNCVGVFPRPIVDRYCTDGLTAVPLVPDFPWKIAVILKKDCYHSYAATSLLGFVKKYFEITD